ncbi:Uncharacterised protein [uncultured archaeon]|nr:Uncharacterised protein [uncultured archaeon]
MDKSLTLKSLGHILLSYSLAAYSSIELVLSPNFKQFVMDKLSSFSSVQQFLTNQFPALQLVVGALTFNLLIGSYNHFVVNYFKRRKLRNNMKKLDDELEKFKAERDELDDKIKAFKRERDAKVNDLIEKAQKDIERLYKGYNLAVAMPMIEHAIDIVLESNIREVTFYTGGNPNVLEPLAEKVVRETGTDVGIDRIKEMIAKRIKEIDL